MLTPAPSELKITIQQVEIGITKKNILLDERTTDHLRLVEDRAQKERNWLIAQRKLLIETDESVTLRKDIVKGDRNVSKLKMEFEIALGVERSNLESMKNLRGQLDVLRSFLSWHKSEKFPSTM